MHDTKVTTELFCFVSYEVCASSATLGFRAQTARNDSTKTQEKALADCGGVKWTSQRTDKFVWHSTTADHRASKKVSLDKRRSPMV